MAKELHCLCKVLVEEGVKKNSSAVMKDRNFGISLMFLGRAMAECPLFSSRDHQAYYSLALSILDNTE